MIGLNGQQVMGWMQVTGPIQREDNPVDSTVTIEKFNDSLIRVTVRDAYFPDDWAVSFVIENDTLIRAILDAVK